MIAIKSARHYIESHPQDPDAATLSRLVIALESGDVFPLSLLYELPFERFSLALEVLAEWRLERYYASKVKLLDVSLQMQEFERPGTPQGDNAS